MLRNILSLILFTVLVFAACTRSDRGERLRVGESAGMDRIYYSTLNMLNSLLVRNGEYGKVLRLTDEIIADVENDRESSGISEQEALCVKCDALTAKNRSLYERIQQREQAETEQREQLQAQPEDSLTTEEQLYRRLCTLMTEQQPYTDETLNRDTLAQMLGTNAKYVVQAIRECSHGETVGDFITRHRLEHVAHLLKTTDSPISLIGEQSGIPSRFTLASLFRNAYGMTCSEYRRIAKEEAK